jgi:hypothetical protein
MSQTAKDVLQIYGLGVADAAAFINANLKNPQVIFDTAKKFGITNQHLSEITGYPTDVIQSFWLAHGLKPAVLDADAAITKVNLVEIAIQKFTPSSLASTFPSSHPLTKINANTGPFKFIVDFNDYKDDDREIGRFDISGFGSDDSLEIHTPGAVFASNFFNKKTVAIDVWAVGGFDDGGIEILLTGLPITSKVESVNVFNSLPLGNIDIV